MAQYRVVSLSKEVADQVRKTHKAPDYGHPAFTEVAGGYGPCRECLRTFQVGQENRILFTYDPFRGVEKVPLPGPIFIHEQPCEPYPEKAGYPRDLETHAAVFNAFANGQKLVERVVLSAEADKASALDELFHRPDVDYVEVRDAEAGCFDFRAERVAEKVFKC
ncbi:MAG: DUF1203 domain-containing protein [Terriglobales bacterium]|jgi:hypothetical protein